MKQQGLVIPNNKNNQFLTLGKLIWKVSVATLASAIDQNGIYTWDRFGRFVLADDKSKAIALNLLETHYKWECAPVDEENSIDPRSPMERWADIGDKAYEHFGWQLKMVPDFDKILGTLIDAEEDATNPKPRGHLSHDPAMQKRANQIAADRRATTGRSITRDKVANLLAEELEMDEATVLRRIRKQWA